MKLLRVALSILFLLALSAIHGKDPVSDRFVTSDLIGGNRVYFSDSPILGKDKYYRGVIEGYDGRHFSNWAIYGRNSDSEEWTLVFNFSGKRASSFISPGDFLQVKIGWSKNGIEPEATISYRIAEEIFDHSTMYVSSSEGDDCNDGSESNPFATILKAISMKPATIRLRCGDIFHDPVRCEGIDFAPYSTGEKPLISGLKILPERAWQLEETLPSGMKIWKVNLSMEREAYKGMGHGGDSFLNNIGGFVRIGKSIRDSELCGSKRVWHYEDLKKEEASDFDFFQPLDTPAKSTPATNFDYVYVCYRGTPDDRFGVTGGTNGMEIGGCKVDSLSIRHWGRHGIAGKSGVSITDCDIEGIGGMVQLEYPALTCLGNGIEFYVQHPGISNCHVERCHVSHCYDAGLTVQGSEHDPANLQPLEAHDVTFRHNVIENCGQSFEEFLNGNNITDVYYGCLFADNVSHSPGTDTGFRYSDGRYKRSHILTYENDRPTGMVFRDNVCTDGNYLCVLAKQGKYSQGIWQGNKCKIRRGQDLLGNYTGTSGVITVPVDKGLYLSLEAATRAAIARYRELTGDTTTEFTVAD